MSANAGVKAFVWLIAGGALLVVAGIVTALNAKQEWALQLGITLAVIGGLIAFASILARAFLSGVASSKRPSA